MFRKVYLIYNIKKQEYRDVFEYVDNLRDADIKTYSSKYKVNINEVVYNSTLNTKILYYHHCLKIAEHNKNLIKREIKRRGNYVIITE